MSTWEDIKTWRICLFQKKTVSFIFPTLGNCILIAVSVKFFVHAGSNSVISTLFMTESKRQKYINTPN